MKTRNKIWIFPLAWWLIWMTFHAWYLIHTGWNLQVAVTDSLISNLLLAALCSGMLFSVQYNRPDARRSIYLFAGILISSALWVWLSGQLLIELSGKENAYPEFIRATAVIRFLFGFFMIALFALIGWISFFIKDRIEEKNRAAEITQLARESELIHLRQQLQPHFLFNTLNSVSALISSDAPAAKKMILQLSDFLRGTLKKNDITLVPFTEELNYLSLYLEIEKVRFGNRLATSIFIDPSVSTQQVPVFLLQPLLENAIKFGLYDTIEPVKIEISATYQTPFLIISISNPFDATSAAAVPGTGFGLNAVKRRLFLLFSRNDLLEVISADNKFTTILKIPQKHV